MLLNMLDSIKKILFIIGGCLLIVLSIFTCQAQNLISNPSFEISGQLSCISWYEQCGRELTFLCDTIFPDTVCGAQFYQDAPVGGGNWSLEIIGTGNNPPSYAETYITGQSGTHIYELSIWMKDSGDAFGAASINIISQGQLSSGKSVSADSVSWALFTLSDTLTLQPSDTIVVFLSVVAPGPLMGSIFFDLVELKKNDSTLMLLTTTSDISCYGYCDGSATAIVGGVPPFTYQWDDSLNQTTQTATGLCAGAYTVIVTDSIGQADTASVNIDEPLALTTNVSNTICNGDSTYLGGSYQTTAGTYKDTLPSVNGKYLLRFS